MHTKKQILDLFSDRLTNNFIEYCNRFGQPQSLDNFITYLIDQDIIAINAVQRYTLIEEYNKLYQCNGGQKTRTVNDLAQKYNITSRSIWNLLRKERHRIAG